MIVVFNTSKGTVTQPMMRNDGHVGDVRTTDEHRSTPMVYRRGWVIVVLNTSKDAVTQPIMRCDKPDR